VRKLSSYYASERDDIQSLMPVGPHKVLEIGAGWGNLGAVLKKSGKAAETTGVELIKAAADVAALKLDRVFCGDIESMEIDLPEKYFDYVICGDVLEHLKDPWAVLEKLKPCLKDSGTIIASLPNVRHWRVVKDLVLNGKWEYKTDGTLDSTHLRFFTRKSAVELLCRAGFTINRVDSALLGKAKIIDAATLHVFSDFLAFKYLIVASKGRGFCES
jgi:2-polyprenyl-3-methyl-5-hydroxy-6-metoxy-1,4-benzoquinol methylase